MILILRRTEMSNEATFGQLCLEDGHVICQTLEEPWRNNQRGRSCIPPSTYKWFIRTSWKHGGNSHRDYDVPELVGVPNRSNVQIHIGNTLADTEGCILVGTQRSDPLCPPLVAGSKTAFAMLMAAIGEHTEGELEVVNP